MVETINLADKLGRVTEVWSPRIVGELNDSYIKVVRLRGAFVWHHHEREDELFLVVRGTLTMRLRDRDLRVGVGEMVIIPRGVEHCPVADDEVHIVLIEPKSTVNTGSTGGERTVADQWV